VDDDPWPSESDEDPVDKCARPLNVLSVISRDDSPRESDEEASDENAGPSSTLPGALNSYPDERPWTLAQRLTDIEDANILGAGNRGHYDALGSDEEVQDEDYDPNDDGASRLRTSSGICPSTRTQSLLIFLETPPITTMPCSVQRKTEIDQELGSKRMGQRYEYYAFRREAGLTLR
jgi:hypothetical protein